MKRYTFQTVTAGKVERLPVLARTIGQALAIYADSFNQAGRVLVGVKWDKV